MSQASTTTAAIHGATGSDISASGPRRAALIAAASAGATVGLLLGISVLLASDRIAIVLHLPHLGGYVVPAIVCGIYAFTGMVIGRVMQGR